MGVRERILIIRLMEKAKKNRAYMQTIGIVIGNDPQQKKGNENV